MYSTEERHIWDASFRAREWTKRNNVDTSSQGADNVSRTALHKHTENN